MHVVAFAMDLKMSVSQPISMVTLSKLHCCQLRSIFLGARGEATAIVHLDPSAVVKQNSKISYYDCTELCQLAKKKNLDLKNPEKQT